jgi:hypothetical protein
MKNNYGKKFSLKSYRGQFESTLKEKSYYKKKKIYHYLDKIGSLLKKKIHLKCLICQEFFFNWESYISMQHENFHFHEHPITIVSPVFYPDSNFGWCVEEEILFKIALEILGYSNWNLFSVIIETKSSSECENYFYKIHGEFGIKNQKKNWRIYSSQNFLKEELKEWQSYLPICNIKVEKKEGWLPQRCELVYEYEENFEDFLLQHKCSRPKFYYANREKDESFFFEYNKRIFFRDTKKKSINLNHTFSSQYFNKFANDDSFVMLIPNIQRENKKKIFKQYFILTHLRFKKIKNTNFVEWIFDFDFIKKKIERNLIKFEKIYFNYIKSLSTDKNLFFSKPIKLKNRYKKFNTMKNIFFHIESISVSITSFSLHKLLIMKLGMLKTGLFNGYTFFKSCTRLIPDIILFFRYDELTYLPCRKKTNNMAKTKKNNKLK